MPCPLYLSGLRSVTTSFLQHQGEMKSLEKAWKWRAIHLKGACSIDSAFVCLHQGDEDPRILVQDAFRPADFTSSTKGSFSTDVSEALTQVILFVTVMRSCPNCLSHWVVDSYF